MKHPNSTFTTILFTLGFLALCPIAQAVVPAPDGGYPNFTTAEGQNALKNLSTGQGNTATGWFSLFSDTTGSFNTGVGAGALALNTGDSNTATGAVALFLNTTGFDNTATGAQALLSNTTGFGNTANGTQALTSNTDGGFNTATGAGALFDNIDGTNNTADGFQALASNLGTDNAAVGYQALFNNTLGDFNTATGSQALFNETNGSNNTANGSNALFHLTSATANTADGSNALFSNNTGADNTAIGKDALFFSTGDGNTALGSGAGGNVAFASNVICIGTGGQDVSNSCYIGNIFGVTSAGGVGVFVNADGKLGTSTSSRRFKEDIKPMDKASEALFALKPVTFRYKKAIDPKGTWQFGLVAEEVDKVNQDLVVRDKEGKVYSVRYDQVNAMLLNEFLKEHRKVEELEATIAQQQKGMETLTAQLKEQAAQIQKVSAQVEMNKPTPRVVLNNP
jgi:hypothetical protein